VVALGLWWLWGCDGSGCCDGSGVVVALGCGGSVVKATG
jgi:hypothetical protein